MNIPIYRAKRLDSDEYVEGNYNYMPAFVAKEEYHAINGYMSCSAHGYDTYEYEIDPSTLSMRMPDTEKFYSVSLITRLVQDMEEEEL